jgi:epoxyqueuosine reductase
VQTQISADRTSWIRDRARTLGFDLCGVVHVEEFGELAHLPEWLAHGYAGEMNYLRDPRRADPRLVLEGARSLIVVALNYNSDRPHSTELPSDADDESPRGWISRYAWGEDYHELLREKLNALVAEMRAEIAEPFEARAYVDTGPIIERVAAKHAGLGWLAKNTCLINQQLGSWLFLGVIVTTLELEPSLAPFDEKGAAPPPQDLCGSCTRCLDACPTQAFPEPYVLDASRCISYLSIELRGPIPEELRPQMGSAVIGCDICQDVCPWNRKAPVTSLAAFQPREFDRTPTMEDRNSKLEMRNSSSIERSPRISSDELRVSLFAPSLEWLASLSQEQFSAIFRGSAAKRTKWRGLVRNACVALGNSRLAPGSPAHARIIALLDRLAASDDSLIADHARWALARLCHPEPGRAVRGRR